MDKKMMNAAVVKAKGVICYEKIPEPEVHAGEVKVRVKACGICGSDIPRALGDAAFFYPIVLGHEFVGEIAEVGEGVSEVIVGDTVAGIALKPCMCCEDCARGDFGLCKNYSFLGSRENGAFADYVVVPQKNVVKYDPQIPCREAVLFEPASVAVHGLRVAGFTGGGTAAIIGGGTIGIFVEQLCLAFGATKVVVLDIERERLSMAQKYGCHGVVCTKEPNCVEQALAMTNGRGYDWVFEVAGQPATIKMSYELAAARGTICYIGFPHVSITFEPRLWEQINLKELRLVGSRMSYTAPFPGPDWTLTAHYLKTGQLKIDPDMIFKCCPMEAAAEAFKLFKTPGRVKGKIILENKR